MYYIDNMQKQIKMAKQHRKCMEQGFNAYNKVCQDYEHLIEYYKYDAVQGAKILSGLRDARVKRRFYKDNMHVMDSVIDNLYRVIRNIRASQKRIITRSNWNVEYGEDIQAIIHMREKK